MGLPRVRRLGAAFFAAASAAVVLTAPATAQPVVDWNDAAHKLHAAAVASGNPEAIAAMERLLAAPKTMAPQRAALPAQVFQVPAYSDTGRLDPATGQLYGSGIALGIDGFRFGFFGGPGTISPNQGGARMDVMWFNLANGRSGSNQLVEHQDVPVDTSIRTPKLDTGTGTIVAAVYGSLWHRWPVPVSDQHPDGYQYVKSTIFWPSLGAVLG